MNKYAKALAKELNIDDNELQAAIKKVSSESLGDNPTITHLKRELDITEEPRVIHTCFEFGVHSIMAPPIYASDLRALLMTWEEEALLPGTRYCMPVPYKGEFVIEWQPEHDEDKTPFEERIKEIED